MGTLFNVDATSGDLTTVGSIISTSTTSGFLPPRLTTTQRNLIVSPATGLEIYNLTTNQPEVYNGTIWTSMGGGTPAGSNTQVQFNNSGVFGASSNLTFNSGTNVLSVPGLSAPLTSNGSVIINNGQDVPRVDLAAISTANAILQLRNSVTPFNWQFLASGTTGVLQVANITGTSVGFRLKDVSIAAQMSLGSSDPDTSAVLDLQGVTRGFLPPRLSTTQRNAIASPATGLQIYNLTTVQPEVYNGTSWVAMGGGSGTVTSVALTVPAFLSVSGSPVTTSGTLAVSLSGTALPVANGGTGATSLTAHDVLIGNGTSAITPITPSTSGFVLTSTGTGSDPAFKPSGIGNVGSIAGTGTVTPDASTASTFAPTNVSGALTINGPTNGVDGQRVTFRLLQDGTGHTVTFATGANNFRFSIDIPSFSASAATLTDYVAAIWNGAASRWDIVSVIQGF